MKKRNSLTISGLSPKCWEKIQQKKKEVLDKKTTCPTGEAIERLIIGDEEFENDQQKSKEAK